MKISTVLDQIDLGQIALPEFQRGYVWNREQVRALMHSLYRKHPVGGLLMWNTKSEGAPTRGEGLVTQGFVNLLLDGQQRITSLYGIIRGRPPKFFDGNPQAFTGLHFHLEHEIFEFYGPVKMQGDPLWVNVTELMQDKDGKVSEAIFAYPEVAGKVGLYSRRLRAIEAIKDIDLYVDTVSGEEKGVDVVVDIFNRVNSGGTKLSTGDLALAKVCATLPDARASMKDLLAKWRKAGFFFDLDWLLRNITTVSTNQARFAALEKVPADDFRAALAKTEGACDLLLNLISGRLGLDHDRVLFGRYAFPVLCRYLMTQDGKFHDARERDRILFWFIHSALWGRFSGSTETFIMKDLEVLQRRGLDGLVEELRLWRGDLRIQPEHFGGWSLGARFYPMLYLLARIGEAKDWATGLPIRLGMLGRMSVLHQHHIFPKSVLKKLGHPKDQRNAIANYCFLTQEGHQIFHERYKTLTPDECFEDVESRFPGALASQWIPMDRDLWKVENYQPFLAARRQLLADAANTFLDALVLGGMPETLPMVVPTEHVPYQVAASYVPGGAADEEEAALHQECSEWAVRQGLPPGEFAYELRDPRTGDPLAILDLAWPNGLQEGLTGPVAVLLDEGPEVMDAANRAGYRCFTSVAKFKEYVRKEILGEEEETETGEGPWAAPV